MIDLDDFEFARRLHRELNGEDAEEQRDYLFAQELQHKLNATISDSESDFEINPQAEAPVISVNDSIVAVSPETPDRDTPSTSSQNQNRIVGKISFKKFGSFLLNFIFLGYQIPTAEKDENS